MAQVTAARLRESGRLPREHRAEKRVWVVEDELRKKLTRGIRLRAESSTKSLAQIEYGPDAQVAYDLGCWGVAYLCHKSEPNALLETFLPQLDEQGWDAAFTNTFGMTPEVFYAEFDRFLTLPWEQQREVLP